MTGSDQSHGRAARASAACITFVAAATLALRVILATADQGSIAAGLWDLARFFTVLTNTLIMILMLAIWAGRLPSARLIFALVTAIAAVGIVYHLLLAKLWSPQGWVLVADHGVHAVVPLLSVLCWLAFGRAGELTRRDALWVVIWPLCYCVYALVRGAADGTFPYPFLDLAQLGPARVASNIAGLVVIFLVLGEALRLLPLGFRRR